VTRYAGVDGCPGGRWVIARGDDPTGDGVTAIDIEVTDDLRPLLAEVRRAAVAAVGIDMPIGLLDEHPRPADVEARRLLGARRSSIFPTPLRFVLTAADYTQACDLSRQACGRSLTKQTFHLLDRIRLLDTLVTPHDQRQVVEAHPELAFVRLNDGAPLETTKHQEVGRRQRRALLSRELDGRAIDAALASASAPQQDLLDAMALVTTARRIARGDAVRLGTRIDRTGKRAEIAY
jgi:predicted RNase H-like nuclease